VSAGGRGRHLGRLIEAGRRINSHPKLVDRATRIRERALGDEQSFDHLSLARNRPADLALRELVALRGERPGVLGEVGLTALQAWQRLSESQGRGRGELDVAVLFTDLAGFSSWALEAGDDSALSLLRQVSDAIEPPIVRRKGEVVKRLGDGLMAAFWNAPSAIEAAFDARERAAEVEVSGYVPRLRTGIHLGRPRKIGGDYFGVDVNIAARLADAAEPGEILISARTLEALGDGAPTASRRPFSAKGAPDDLSVFALQDPSPAGG
jgi:adenylate cyclase